MRQDSKCILYYPARSRQTVVEDSLFMRQSPHGEWFHEPRAQWKSIITNYEKWHGAVPEQVNPRYHPPALEEWVTQGKPHSPKQTRSCPRHTTETCSLRRPMQAR